MKRKRTKANKKKPAKAPDMFTMYRDERVVTNPTLLKIRSVARIPYDDFLRTLGRDE